MCVLAALSFHNRRFARHPAGQKLALNRAGMAAEFGDDISFLARNRDIVDSGTAAALALDGARYEPVTKLCGIEKSHGAMLRDRPLIVCVAGKSECGIGQCENETAVTDFMPIHHPIGHRHGHDAMARLNRHKLHAKFAAGGVVSPHHVGASPREFSGIHVQEPFFPVKFGWRFSMKARTPSA